MKIGIIGAGFGGLAAGYYLAKAGHDVTLFESGDAPGGLAIGFKEKKWQWTLEHHYHHWFTNDDAVLSLASEIRHKVITVRPKTSTFLSGQILQLDSPLSLLQFEKLSFFDRIRTGIVLGYLKLTPYWKPLEGLTAKRFILKFMGETSWNVLWRPLFEKKFGKYADQIPASWFWSRIKKRTPSLAYPEGGFLSFAEHLSEEIKNLGGEMYFKSSVESIQKKGKKIEVLVNSKKYIFDKVICTLPSGPFLKITKGLSSSYIKKFKQLEGLGAVNMVLALKSKFLKDGTYWVNINELDFPFLAVVEHTNFMNKKSYNGEHLVYVGNYLPGNHPYFQKSEEELLKEFVPYLKKINPRFTKSDIKKAYVFKAPFAQPIIPINYSKNVPSFETPIPGVYLCNMQQVYPWDRGTNYAVENGHKVAELIINH